MHRSIPLVSLATLLQIALPICGRAVEKTTSVIEGWGTFVDPAGDCKVVKRNGRVTITIPETHHNLNPTVKFGKNTDAPRILQTVEGDFDIQVKVGPFPIPEKGMSNNGGGHSYCAAGLLVWQDNRNFVRWFRAANGDRGDVFVHGECWSDANPGPIYYAPELSNRDRTMQNVTAHLRLTRRGDRMTFYRSQNGKSWEAFLVVPDCSLDDTLQVGIAAVNSAKKEFSPSFENFKLTD